MANILLVANLNCDRILNLDKPLQMGGRFHYQDGGKRLGGGGANTGIGLVWAKHTVALASQVGKDKLGDWLLSEASTQGIDCHLIQRHKQNNQTPSIMWEGRSNHQTQSSLLLFPGFLWYGHT